MIESEVEVSSGEAVLSATFCAPSDSGRFPCVLTLPASGPLDRDENIRGQRLNVFNSIAHHLAANGFASLRYDKRGCGKSSGDYLRAGYFDFVADAVACFDHLQRDEQCSAGELYALGHSEGTMTAMQLSLERPLLSGVIQLCPCVESVESALLRQARHVRVALRELPGFKGMLYRLLARINGDPIASTRRLIERVKSNAARPREVESKHIGLQWLREMLELDVRKLYAQMRCPILVIAGTKDFQCDPAEVQSIRELTQSPIDINVVSNLTHILRFDEREPSVFHYPELIRRPLETAVLSLISEWLLNQSPRRPAGAEPDGTAPIFAYPTERN